MIEEKEPQGTIKVTPMRYEKNTVMIKYESQKGYTIDIDSLNRKKVKIYFYKGTSLADVENIITGKLLMVRVKIQFVGDLSKYIPIDGLVSRNIVEGVDIDFYLIEHFFLLKMEKYHVTRLLTPLWEMCKYKKIGEFIGSITIDYEKFTSLVTYLQYLSFETFRREDVL